MTGKVMLIIEKKDEKSSPIVHFESEDGSWKQSFNHASFKVLIDIEKAEIIDWVLNENENGKKS